MCYNNTKFMLLNEKYSYMISARNGARVRRCDWNTWWHILNTIYNIASPSNLIYHDM